jgi:hypothetical protein
MRTTGQLPRFQGGCPGIVLRPAAPGAGFWSARKTPKLKPDYLVFPHSGRSFHLYWFVCNLWSVLLQVCVDEMLHSVSIRRTLNWNWALLEVLVFVFPRICLRREAIDFFLHHL